MTYKSVDIPFVQGQDESFDIHILPVGPLRRIQDSYAERTGRMRKREDFEPRPTTDASGNDWASTSFVAGFPNDYVMVEVDVVTSKIISFKPGNTAIMATGEVLVNPGVQTTILPKLGGGVFSSLCVSVGRFAVYMAYIADGTWHCDIYLKEDMSFIRTQSGEDPCNVVKVIASKAQDGWVVCFALKGVLQIIDVHYFQGQGSTGPAAMRTQQQTGDGWEAQRDEDGAGFVICGHDSEVGVAMDYDHYLWCEHMTIDNMLPLNHSVVVSYDRFLGTSQVGANCACAARDSELFYFAVIRDSSASVEDTHLFAVAVGGVVSEAETGNTNTRGEMTMMMTGGAPPEEDECRMSFKQIDDSEYFLYTLDPVLSDLSVQLMPFVGDMMTSPLVVKNEFYYFSNYTGAAGGPLNLMSMGDLGLSPPALQAVLDPFGGGGVEIFDNGDGMEVLPHSDVLISNVYLIPSNGGLAFSAALDLQWEREGEELYDHDLLFCGSVLSAVVSDQVFIAGFPGQPVLTIDYDNAGVSDGIYKLIGIAVFTDGEDHVWRSQPSDIYELEKFDADSFNYTITAPTGSPPGTTVELYITPAGGNIFDLADKGDNAVPNSSDFLPLQPIQPLYTEDGTRGNAAPPSCKYITRSKDRYWIGGLITPSRVQASKFLAVGEGVHWDNGDQWFADIQESVTGVAVMDDTLIVFSENNIYIVTGQGPDNQGTGFWDVPRSIPSDGGCSNFQSIVESSFGVFYMSKRGLEMINRGFSAPVFIGAPVYDVTEAYPHCLGAILLETESHVRWLLTNNDRTETRIVVYDLVDRVWFVYTADTSAIGLTRALGGNKAITIPGYPRDAMALYPPLMNSAIREITPAGTRPQVFETGEIRPGGLNGGVYARRLNVLGTFQGDSVIKLEMAFNDARDFSTKYIKEWTIGEAEGYQPGDAVVLELTLPVQKVWACRFRVTETSVTEGIHLHGLTLFYDGEGEGPRVGAGSKG